jgi:outer membrane lipoprotein-sorting protein
MEFDMRNTVIAAMTLAIVCAACLAQRATRAPGGATSTIAVVTAATNPSAAGTNPSTPATASAPAVDPQVAELLARIEAAGNEYKTIRAELELSVPAKFRFHFDTLTQGGSPAKKEPLDYAFDGLFLTVRKEKLKEMTRYQVAAEGQKIEPLRLGQGPFPLPFWQKAEDVKKYFTVATRPAAAGEPKDTVYLRLSTRDEYKKEMNFDRLEMWLDAKTLLPAKFITVELRGSKNVTTVTLTNATTNKEVDPKLFDLPRPTEPGWTYRVEPLEKK